MVPEILDDPGQRSVEKQSQSFQCSDLKVGERYPLQMKETAPPWTIPVACKLTKACVRTWAAFLFQNSPRLRLRYYIEDIQTTMLSQERHGYRWGLAKWKCPTESEWAPSSVCALASISIYQPLRSSLKQKLGLNLPSALATRSSMRPSLACGQLYSGVKKTDQGCRRQRCDEVKSHSLRLLLSTKWNP